MRIVFTSTAGLGHLYPLMPLARAARDARRLLADPEVGHAALGQQQRPRPLHLPHRLRPQRYCHSIARHTPKRDRPAHSVAVRVSLPLTKWAAKNASIRAHASLAATGSGPKLRARTMGLVQGQPFNSSFMKA